MTGSNGRVLQGPRRVVGIKDAAVVNAEGEGRIMFHPEELDLTDARVALENGQLASVREPHLPTLRELLPALGAGERLYCLSVHQPWASEIAAGRKSIELRAWRTRHRGPLIICASKRPRVKGLPHGAAVALVEVIDSRPFEPEDARGAQCDWRPGLFAWVLRLIRALEPFPVKGYQGLFRHREGRGAE